MKKTLALFLLLTCLPRASAEVKIEGDLKVSPPKYMAVLKARSTETGTSFLWRITDKRLHVIKRGDEVILAGPPGSYDVTLIGGTIKGGALLLEEAEATVVIGKAEPGPGPGPDPGPTPPPDPPTPAPIPEPGFRALIVYESAELAKLPPAQHSVLFARSVRDYLKAKCAVEADGKTSAFRIWDKDADASDEAKVWQDALKRANDRRTALPWIVISNGKTGHEGPLPENVEKTLELLKKHGG